MPFANKSLVLAWGVLAILCTPILSAQTNGALREVFYNIAGNAVSDLTGSGNYPNRPDEEFIATSFEAPTDFADSYGQRMRALLTAPATGSYVFWLSSDDNSVLYLSTDEDPVHKTQIASVPEWTSSREWNKFPSQKSTTVTLNAGVRYYLEALQKEGYGGDNLAVTWQRPGDPAPANGAPAIPGSYLTPYGLGPPIITVQPTNVSVVEGGFATFEVQLSHHLGAVFQWQRNGTSVPDATNSSLTVSPAQLSDSGATFRCAITNSYGSTNSAIATLTVNPDVTRPALNAVSSLGEPEILVVVFSEPVEASSATSAINYSIDQGVSVLTATFGADTRTIVLTTTPMTTGTSYTLTVNTVRDRATTPNAILPNSQRTFSLDTSVLAISYVRPPPEPIGPSTRRGPLILSEIMFHPTNRVDGRNIEFVEVFNSNPYFEDISGFRISGEVEFTFPSNTLLAGRSYLVVAAVPADVQSVYGIAGVLGPYTNSLANGGGTLRLRNRQDAILFEVNYSGDPPWPAAADGAGHSLVLARPSLGERNPESWAASDTFGGSPGRAEIQASNPYRTVVVNELMAHTDEPELDFIELYNYGTQPVDLAGCVITDDPATNKFIISSVIIPARGFVSFNQTELGFALSAAGETLYFMDSGRTRVIEAVRFGAQQNGVSLGRSPDGSAGLRRLQTKTPGAANARERIADVVINEIMYEPVSGEEDDEYLELYNRTSNPVDVGLWRLTDGVEYTIPPGTILPPGGFLVIAKNAARMLTNHPGLAGATTLGDFKGVLANRGERIALATPDDLVSTNAANQVVTNSIQIVVDEVSYGTGGRWGRWSKAGGSSLELVDARADHRLAPNWADSDESGKSGWVNLEFTGVLDNGNGAADSLQIILLGPGECLVDNVEVIPAGGANLVANSGFESGLGGWVPQGNHDETSLEFGQAYTGSRSLHVRSTGRGDTGANRIRAALTSPLSAGQTATLRAKVRWLAGHPEILLRLKGNWLEATGNILTSRSLGTPGAPNSRARANTGPVITEVQHSPALPPANQPVLVVARVDDPDGLATLVVKYRADPSTNFNVATMVNNGAGLYSATLPGQPSGRIVAFHVEALDNAAPKTVATFPASPLNRECLVRWGDPTQGGNFGTYRFWLSQTNLNRWSTREKLSNKPVDATFVYGNFRVVYNIGGQYSGSPYHSPGFNTPTGNVCDYVLTFPEDNLLLGETDFTLQWPGNGGGDNTYQREQTAYWIGEQIGLPLCYRRHINLFVNGIRRAEMFEDSQQPNGDFVDAKWPEGENGDLHKIQLWFEFDDAGSGFVANGASFQNVTTTGGQKKLARYRWTFARRAAQGSLSNYTNLFSLVDAVNFNGLGASYRQQLESQIDVDNWLKTYAVEHIVGNNDSFAYGGGQNMYTYKPVGDTWKMMIWDIDFAFDSQAPTNTVFDGIGRSNGIDLGEPEYRRRYWQILQDLANGPLMATKSNPVLDAKYNAITASGRTIDNPSSIKTYLSQRRSYLLNLIATNVPSVFSITLNSGSAFSTNRNLITLTGTAPIDVRQILINGAVHPVTWTSVSNWTAQVVLSAAANMLVLQGRDAQGNPVPGASDSIDVSYTGTIQQPESALVINEIMYDPLIPDAGFIEIYNSSTSNAFDLSSWRMDGAGFTFPPGSVLAPGAYGVIAGNRVAFATAYGGSIPVLGEFSGTLDNNGETLRLVRPGETPGLDQLIDEVHYDSEPPWPAARGTGASLQLIDPTRDNNRVANWAGVATNPPSAAGQWRYVTASGVAASSILYVYLQSPGDVYLDDLKLVPGSTPDVGVNSIQNGDFESVFPGPWFVSANHAASTISTTVRRSGASSLHLIASSGGTTQGSSVWQPTSPTVTLGQTYTLSFWYLENTNGGTLTIRLSGGGVRADANIAPGAGGTSSPRYTPGAPNSVLSAMPAFPALWLNEILPNNVSGAADRFGHRHPWVELLNGAATGVDLAGLYLANNYSNLTQWTFPPGTPALGPAGFGTVWVDGNPAESTPTELHSSFTIPPDSGSLALVQVAGGRTNILDYLNYGTPGPDRSYGSTPDGSVSGRRFFHYPTPGATNNPAFPPVNVVINEWMADNSITLTDPADDDFEDWFELYNPASTAADLTGYYLASSLTNRTQFQIPNGYAIPPHGYLLVWADSETGQNSSNRIDLHASFKLSKLGDAIGLFAPDTTTIDYVSFATQSNSISQGRYPDGLGGVQFLTSPSPRASNRLDTDNTPPVVTAIADQTVIAGQLLLLTVSAVDTDSPAQTILFSLAAGAPAGATINPASGLFSWRPGDSLGSTTNTITVLATDDGQPPLTDTATFSVRNFPRPRFTALARLVDGSLSLVLETVPGKTYRIESKNNLDDPFWIPLDVDLTATGETIQVSDPAPGSEQRFYRVLVLD